MKTLAPSAGQKLPALRPGEFRLITKGITIEKAAEADGAPRRRFRTIMSSTIRDERGDEIKPPALQKMRDQFAEGRTIFLNHSYKVPEDVFGTSDFAEIKATGLRDENGQEIYDLLIAGDVNSPNPRADQLADSLEGNYVKFGASIGAIVRKHKKNDAGGMDIWDLDTKEGSIVGIPMNQRSWVQKAVDAATALDDEEEDEETAEPEPEEDAEPSTDIPLDPAPETVTASLDTTEGAALQRQDLDTKEDDCESCGHGAGCDCDACDCSASIHSTKSIAAGDLTVKTDEGLAVDETAPGGQEADAATPETAPADETEDEPAAADEASAEKSMAFDPEDVVELVRHVRDLATSLAERDDRITALADELATIKADRDRLASENGEATAVIEKLMTRPLARKAADYANGARRLPSSLAPEVASFLQKTSGDRQ